MQIWRFCILLVVAVVWGSSLVGAKPNGATLSLEKLIAEALQSNPQIKSAEGRWRAAQNRSTQVSTLPDPMFKYTRFGSSVETRVGPQENVFALSQRIPFPGKLGLTGRMADQDAFVEEQKYEVAKRDVVYEVKRAYFDLYWIDQSLGILEEYLALLRDFTRVAEQKYATGQGSLASVLKSQVEISSLMERRLGFKGMRHHIEVRINALLNRPEDTEVATAADPDTVLAQFDKQQLIERALLQREELLAAEAIIDKSNFMKSLARKNYLPDFSVEANYKDVAKGVSTAPDAGKNAWSIELGLNLPIWVGKRKAAVNEAEETLVASQLSRESLKNEVISEVSHLHHELHLSTQTIKLYEQGLLAQAQGSLQSALASYQTGKLDFLNLLDAERTLLNLNLSFTKEQANYQKQLAALERAVGGDLP